MNHIDHVNLLQGGVPSPGGIWADFGSGTGAFTLALADLIGPAGVIYSIDRDAGALQEQARAMHARFPAQTVHYRPGDFLRALDLPPLDGIIMANALHFHRDKETVGRRARGYLKPGGRFILVEYNVDRGNPWVPFPLSFETWEVLARRIGFTETRLIARKPSRFLSEFYSAVSRSDQPGEGRTA